MDELDRLKVMAGIGNQGRLQEYKGEKFAGSNPSVTAQEKVDYQHQHNIRPGTSEWFRLWFSKPYLTGERPW